MLPWLQLPWKRHSSQFSKNGRNTRFGAIFVTVYPARFLGNAMVVVVMGMHTLFSTMQKTLAITMIPFLMQ
jgi:hypothetical protein